TPACWVHFATPQRASSLVVRTTRSDEKSTDQGTPGSGEPHVDHPGVMHPPTPLADSLGRTFSIRDATAAGMSYGRLRGRDLDLDRPFHGVRAAAPAEGLIERCADYAPRMRDDEFFCSVTAALLHGVPLPLVHERDPRLHVAVPNPRRAPR